MSTLRLRLSDHLFEEASKLAESENLSVNQLITLVLAEKISLFNTAGQEKTPAQRHHRQEIEAKIASAVSLLGEAD